MTAELKGAEAAARFRETCPAITGAGITREPLDLYVSTDSLVSGPTVRRAFFACVGELPGHVHFVPGISWPDVGWSLIGPTEQAFAGAHEPYVYREPTSQLERQLTKIWSELLADPHVGVLDDFWDCGGDSLRLAELAMAVTEAYGIELDYADLASDLTISKLSALVVHR